MAKPLTPEQLKLIAVATNKLKKLAIQQAFDPAFPDSRPTIPQEEIIKDFGSVKQQWIVAANQSGKSQTSLRNLTWMLTDSHPHWTRPAAWANEALLAIVLGRNGKQLEDSIIPRIASYLEPGTYKLVRVGNQTNRMELDNGNRIVFQSYENPKQARERVQSYVAHFALIDEMPTSADLIHELLRRVQTRDGYFMAAFTPLLVNNEIRNMVDDAKEPLAKKYMLRMFDNPRYASSEKQAEVLASMQHMSESQRNARLFGHWTVPDQAVYQFDAETMVEAPPDYSPSWRHVEASDPATQSKFGFTLWAEHPNTGMWYCIRADYIEGVFVPEEILKEVLKRTSGVNIVRRICDPHEAWYIHTASSKGVTYVTPYDKNSRKGELIKGLQTALSKDIRIAPWCQGLIDELQTCQWSETAENKIVNASRFHLLDTAQYFVDCKPKFEGVRQAVSWEAELRAANAIRKKKESLKQTMVAKGMIRNTNFLQRPGRRGIGRNR
jgi:hypothetical protein